MAVTRHPFVLARRFLLMAKGGGGGRRGGGGKSHGPSIKNPRTYEALKREGMSKERAARISNAKGKS